MPKPSPFDPLYSAPIVLWVEDALTEQYLSEVWKSASPLIRIHIAGNNRAVQVLTDAAVKAGHVQVFGLVDRDLGPSNVADWAKPTKRVFRLPRHEIENYLLDPVDLFNCPIRNRPRTLPEVEQRLQELVAQQPAWLAYRKVIREIERDLGHKQPGVPAIATIPTPVVATQKIEGSDWITTLPHRTSRWSTPGTIAQSVSDRHSECLTAIASGDWRADFSGKEIFTPIRDYLYTPRANAGPDHDADFAAEMGVWQAANNRVPQDVADLLSALRTRVGLPP